MNKKYFALIFAAWVIAMLLIFGPQAKGAEVWLVQTSGTPTCPQAVNDFKAAAFRYNQLIDMRDKAPTESVRMVLNVEMDAVLQLATKIRFWMNENCKQT